MTTKEYLQNIRDMRFKIDDMEKERKEIVTAMLRIKSTSDYHEKIKITQKSDKFEKQIIESMEQLEKLDQDLRKKIVDYQIQHNTVRGKIRKLPEGQCRRFLIDYYIEGMSWNFIFKEYGFREISSPYHLQERAINLFEKYFKHEHCLDNYNCDKL